MDSFDTYIARRLPLVSLISTVFIIYPNIACIPWELKYMEGTGVTGLLSFFVYRFLFFWGLISLLIRYNLKKMPATLFKQRLMRNFLFSFYRLPALCLHIVRGFFFGYSYGCFRQYSDIPVLFVTCFSVRLSDIFPCCIPGSGRRSRR